MARYRRSKIGGRRVVEVDGLADGPEERRWRRAARTGAGITSVRVATARYLPGVPAPALRLVDL